jgi:putative MATE family efflux protein
MNLSALFNKIKADPFNKTLLSLSVPIIMQYFINSSLNLVDTIMIGRLGEASIAAVGFANVIYFLLIIAMFGISSGTSIFLAQFWGAKDIKSIKRIQGFSLVASLLIASAFTAAATLFPKSIIGIFSKDTQVIILGAKYIKIVGPSYILTAISICYATVLRSIEKVTLPTIASVVALGTNTILNWILIFGLIGFAPLGVEGAAIATLISRFIEAAIILAVVYYKKFVPASSFFELFSFDLKFVKKTLKITVPVLLNECIWSLGISMYSVIYGHMGTNIAAAANITGTVERMAWILIFGMGGAASIMIGKKIGEKDNDTAYIYGKRILKYTTWAALAISVVLILLSSHVLNLFTLHPQSKTIAFWLMIIFGVFFTLRSLSYMSCIGVLRSGGDANFCLIIDIVGVGILGVPLAFLTGLVWGLPVYIVFIIINAEDCVKFLPYLIRFKSKKWIKNLTN